MCDVHPSDWLRINRPLPAPVSEDVARWYVLHGASDAPPHGGSPNASTKGAGRLVHKVPGWIVYMQTVKGGACAAAPGWACADERSAAIVDNGQGAAHCVA